MFATGLLSPDWWKEAALNHTWYRDDDAYADFKTGIAVNNILPPGVLGVHYDGARASSGVMFPHPQGSVSFTPTEGPFEVQTYLKLELKDPDGNVKYTVSKIMCDGNTLTFTMLKTGTDEEVTVDMGLAPEGFTATGLIVIPEVPPEEPEEVKTGPWKCMCGADNNGKFCTECGTKRP